MPNPTYYSKKTKRLYVILPDRDTISACLNCAISQDGDCGPSGLDCFKLNKVYPCITWMHAPSLNRHLKRKD